jgi:hypothetical protein
LRLQAIFRFDITYLKKEAIFRFELAVDISNKKRKKDNINNEGV